MKQAIRIPLIAVAALFVAANTASASDYYVATTGSDTNAGTSIAAPFRTIGAAAAVVTAGDTCYIRGGTYRETLSPANSGTSGNPITFMPYNAEDVTISGADLVTGWSVYSNSIYQAAMGWDLGEGFNQVFVSTQMVNRARWPNTGTDLLQPTLANGTAAATQITFNVSRDADYWVGGTVLGGFNQKWAWQAADITSSTTSGVLTVANKTTGWWFEGAGKGYITGIFTELDSEGEWFLTGGNLYLWAPGSVDPSALQVEAKARNWCIDLTNRSYVDIRGISCFAGSIRMDNTDHCIIDNVDSLYLSHFTKWDWGSSDSSGRAVDGHNGVWINGSNNTISNSTFRYSAGSGIVLGGGGSNTVTRCVIQDVNYAGIYSCVLTIRYANSGDNQILFNTMSNAGRDILQLYGAKRDTVMYNDMSFAGRLCHDLGITYEWGRDGQGTRIAYNWVHDNLSGGPGIYHDNYCSDFITDHNVIWNCGNDTGVRLNRPNRKMQVYNNTLFSCNDIDSYHYNQYPSYMPGYWSSGGYGNVWEEYLTNNLSLAGSPGSQLVDYANNDFRLQGGSVVIDAGMEIPPYTDGWQGFAPDRGAYEDGLNQWTAGHNGVAVVIPDPPPPDTNAPAVTALSPSDGATNIARNADLIVTFDESVAAGTGLITLKNLTDATQSTIDVTDDTQVTFYRETMTIDPTNDLSGEKLYAIQIASTAIEDLSGNIYSGIADDATWNFTTRKHPGNVLEPDDPLVPVGVNPGDSFHFVFLTSTRFSRLDEPSSPDDITYYNNIVNAVADTSTLAGVPDMEWRAIVSTPTVDARDNTAVSAPVYLLDGSQVATGYADLWDGTIAKEIRVHESGQAFVGGDDKVWSGSSSAGTVHSTYPVGTGGDAVGGTARVGTLNSSWITSSAAGRRGAESYAFYYAMSEVLTVDTGIPVPAITADSPTAILRNSASIAGTLSSTGLASCSVWAFWGGADALQVQTNWDQQIHFGTNTTGVPHAYTTNLTGLTEGTTYYYRFYATNDAGQVSWSDPMSFTTLSAPTVNNASGASGVGSASATLNGNLTDGGSADVSIYWGTTDGGTARANWEYTNSIPDTPQGAFAVSINGLTSGTNYYYRCYGTNVAGAAWAASTETFTTLSGGPLTFVGLDTTSGAGWRSTSVTKALDLDGDNVYGTAGYVVWATGDPDGMDTFDNVPPVLDNPTLRESLPTGVSQVSENGIVYTWSRANGADLDFDNPSLPPSGTVADVQSGLAGYTVDSTTPMTQSMVNIEFDEAVAGPMRIGVIQNGAGHLETLGVRMEQTVGGVAVAEGVAADYGVGAFRYFLFELASAEAGDVFTVSLIGTDGNANSKVSLAMSGLTFDLPPDNDPPTLSSLSPVDGAPNAPVGGDLVATFDEDIALTGGGSIVVTNLDGGSAQVIDLASLPAPAGNVTVSGTELTIMLNSDLAAATRYAVLISADAIQDVAPSPNTFGGILAPTSWNFTTAVPTVPLAQYDWDTRLNPDPGGDYASLVQPENANAGLFVSTDAVDDSLRPTHQGNDSVNIWQSIWTISSTPTLLGSFTVTATPGASLNLGTLNYAWYGQGMDGDTFVSNVEVDTGGAGSPFTFTRSVPHGTVSDVTPIDLTGSDFQGLASVTLTFKGHTSNAFGSDRLGFASSKSDGNLDQHPLFTPDTYTDMILTGTVTPPPPNGMVIILR